MIATGGQSSANLSGKLWRGLAGVQALACLVARRCSLKAGLQLALCIGTAVASDASPQATLQNALQEYQAAMDTAERDVRLERFHRAELLFANVIGEAGSDALGGHNSIRNADLYVNWGNAALGAEHLGTAVLAYRRALQVDPDHERARLNLRHARSLLPSWVPRPEEGGGWDTFFAWASRLSRTEWETGAGFLFLMAAILFGAAIRWRRPGLRKSAILPAIAWAGVVISLVWTSQPDGALDAVVVSPETIGRSADSVHAPARFAQPLSDGTEVRVVAQHDDWARIRLCDGREAWVPVSSVGFVPTPARRYTARGHR